jgi:hypothetical protein
MIVATAQEFLALVWLEAILLSGMLVSATEMLRSVRSNRINPTRRITRAITVTSLFTSTPSLESIIHHEVILVRFISE